MEKKANIEAGTHMNAWVRRPGMEEKFPKLAKELDEDRRVGFEGVKRLGLPTAKSVNAELSDFLKAPEMYFDALDSEKYYVSLDPHEKQFNRRGKADLTREEALAFARECVAEENLGQYEIKVEEYKNKYGGSIVIGPENQIWIEFKKGQQTEIGSGAAKIAFMAKKDEHTGVMRYSFNNPALRQAIFNTLQAIPHEGEGREAKYTSGYFEFALFEENSKLKPIFIDYRENPNYQPKWDQDNKRFGAREKKHKSFLGKSIKSRKALTRADSRFMLRKTKDRNLNNYLTIFDREIEDLQNKRILNVGSGAGVFEKEAKSKGVDITSVDMAYVLEKGRKNFLKNNIAEQTYASLASEMPLKSNTYDLSFYHFSSFHYPKNEMDLYYMLEEGLRVLKKGGKMLIYPAYFNEDGEARLSFSVEVQNQKQLQDYFEKIIQEKSKLETLKMSPMISSKIGDFDICYLEIKKI